MYEKHSWGRHTKMSLTQKKKRDYLCQRTTHWIHCRAIKASVCSYGILKLKSEAFKALCWGSSLGITVGGMCMCWMALKLAKWGWHMFSKDDSTRFSCQQTVQKLQSVRSDTQHVLCVPRLCHWVVETLSCFHPWLFIPCNLDSEICFQKWMQPRLEFQQGAAVMMDSVLHKGKTQRQQGAWRGWTILWKQMYWNQRRWGTQLVYTPYTANM